MANAKLRATFNKLRISDPEKLIIRELLSDAYYKTAQFISDTPLKKVISTKPGLTIADILNSELFPAELRKVSKTVTQKHSESPKLLRPNLQNRRIRREYFASERKKARQNIR